MKAFLNAVEVAKVLKTDRATVIRWIESGRITTAKRPKGQRQWRIPMETVQALLKEHEDR